MKDTKWCPQHGYPLPCNKCGLGEREAGRREVVNWLETYNGSYIDERFFKSKFWRAKLEEWGIE